MKTLIAKKIGMTQIYDENSKSHGVTVLDVSDCRVVQVKNNETDGYSAVQLTIGKRKIFQNLLRVTTKNMMLNQEKFYMKLKLMKTLN